MKKQLSLEEAGRLGGKNRWSKIKPEDRSKIMRKVSAARKLKSVKKDHE